MPDVTLDPASAPVSREDELFFAALDAGELQQIDAALLEALPSTDMVRRRWIRRLPQYLREARSSGRWIWLSEAEREAVVVNGFSPESR